MQILTKEQKWEYSAPSIPTSHWINNGFEEQYIEGMDYLIWQLKDNTIKLRNGRCDHFPHNTQNICLSGGFDDVNDHTILLHDDLLLPHWKEFAIALQLYHNSSRLLNFYLRNVELTSSVMDLLASALKRKAIFKYVVFDGNDFVNTHDGIEFAVETVGYNPKLEQFEWVNNQIERMEDARYLVDAIISHPLINHIRLDSCFSEYINGYDVFRCLFTSGRSFSHIDLEWNGIETGGSSEISDYLATNPPLISLYLANNHLNDDDAILIARALKQNNNLKDLRLGDNDLTEIGKNALSNAIYDSTSLNSVSDCNHSCYIDGIGGNMHDPSITPKCNRARKMYHLLSLRSRERSNVKYLNSEFDDEDDSLTLVPNVLASVQQYCYGGMHDYSDQVHPLSIMYEILRSWKMPQLYECRGMTTKK